MKTIKLFEFFEKFGLTEQEILPIFDKVNAKKEIKILNGGKKCEVRITEPKLEMDHGQYNYKERTSKVERLYDFHQSLMDVISYLEGEYTVDVNVVAYFGGPVEIRIEINI